MPVRTRTYLAAVVALVFWQEAGAQQSLEDKPKVLEPSKPAAKALDRREALKLYGLGLLCERENRLLEALGYFEEAARLDPSAAALQKCLIPLYLAVERGDDALEACKRTLENDPIDFETWYLRAKLHKNRGDVRDAARSLDKALACATLKEQQPDLYIQIASDLAVLREEMKDVAAAIAAYEKVTAVLENPAALMEAGQFTRKEIDGRAAEVYERLATLCLQQKDFEKAVTALTRAQKKDRDIAPRLNYHLAKVRQAQGKPADALRYLDAYLKIQPPGTEAYELKVELLAQAGRGNEVLDALKDAAERDTHNLALQLLLAKQYRKDRQWADAENVYKGVIREAPSPEAYAGLFGVYKEQGPGRIREALDQLDKALKDAKPREEGKPEIRTPGGRAFAAACARSMLAVLRDDPELVRALLKLSEDELKAHRARERETWRYLAVLAARTKQLESAERLFRQCLESMGGEDPRQGEVYGGLLRVLWQRRRYEEIVSLSRKGLKEAKQLNHLLFYDHLLRSLAQLGKYDEALTECEKAVGIADDDSRIHFKLYHARLLSMADRHDKAAAECLELLKQTEKPDDIREVRYALSGVYSAAKQHAKSEEQLRLILEANPKDETACNDLGYTMADRGKNLEEAETLVRKAIALDREQKRLKPKNEDGDGEESKNEAKVGVDDDQDHAAYVDSLGWVLFRRGKIEEAKKELARAVKLGDGGDDPVIWDHLGDVCLRLGQKTEAKAAFRKALELYEVDRRRKKDDQYKELQQKVRLLESR
jgi:tetratricopeptide (TPR) repeat protein